VSANKEANVPFTNRSVSRRAMGAAFAAALAALAPGVARAQTACRTPDCSQTTPPPACQKRATPRTATVLMTSTRTFSPAEPKIEPGDCIAWTATGLTHSSSADPCSSAIACSSPSPVSCLWDSGNVSSTDSPPAVICAYNPASYPPETADGYYCRFHDNPSHTGTMHGILHVTTAIHLTASKDTGSGSVVLTWTGGGITGDLTYLVVRSELGDPTFPVADLSSNDPDAGATGTQFTDLGELSNPTTRFYLVRNRQSTE
jgi:plastocyanin